MIEGGWVFVVKWWMLLTGERREEKEKSGGGRGTVEWGEAEQGAAFGVVVRSVLVAGLSNYAEPCVGADFLTEMGSRNDNEVLQGQIGRRRNRVQLLRAEAARSRRLYRRRDVNTRELARLGRPTWCGPPRGDLELSDCLRHCLDESGVGWVRRGVFVGDMGDFVVSCRGLQDAA